MPTPAVTLKLKRFRRRFGISAPRVVVRSHLSWRWSVLLGAVLALLLGAVGWLITQRNEAGVLGRELESLRQQVQAQRRELDVLRSTAGTGQNAVSIERAAQQQLLGRVRTLEAENAGLKEDVLLYERLVSVTGDSASVRVENFRLFDESGGRFRYRLLIAFQPDKQNPDFLGRLQIVISYARAGKTMQMLLPEKQNNSAEYQFEIKRFLRREGGFELPAGAELREVEAQILQGNTLKSRRVAQL